MSLCFQRVSNLLRSGDPSGVTVIAERGLPCPEVCTPDVLFEHRDGNDRRDRQTVVERRVHRALRPPGCWTTVFLRAQTRVRKRPGSKTTFPTYTLVRGIKLAP
jgi:hypothetical protein